MKTHRLTTKLICLLWLVAAQFLSGTAYAQSGNMWSTPVNLSHSGSASQPVLVAGMGDSCQVFWQDRFDGLMSTYYDGQSWSLAAASPILISEVVERVPGQPEVVRSPITQMPQIAGDQGGRAHAFWLAQTQDTAEEEGQPTLYALMHSTWVLGQTTWSNPEPVAESVLTWQAFSDVTGRLHLLYVRPTHTDQAPAGIYYTSLARGASDWSSPQVVYPSIYARLFEAEQIHLAGAADGAGHVVAAWNDPRLGRTFTACSADNGASWQEPTGVTAPNVTFPQLAVAGGEGRFLALWQSGYSGTAAAFYQQESADGGTTWDAPRRVLEGLDVTTADVSLQSGAGGSLVLIAGTGGPGLTLALWQPANATKEWSAPQLLGMSLADPETKRTIWLDGLQIALGGSQVMLVGQGQDGEIWALQREAAGLAWAFPSPSPWSEPISLSRGREFPSLPAVTADDGGGLHVLWSEEDSPSSSTDWVPLSEDGGGIALSYAHWDGSRWVGPAQVLESPEGQAVHPSLVVVGGRLHAVWDGGAGGQVYYSRAFLRDGSTAGGWSEPLAMPGPQGSQGVGIAPNLMADLRGNLHLAYAVPLNEGRGIYYLRSEDGGESWSPLRCVFDAVTAGWASVNSPVLALDLDGTLYVAWVRATLSGGVSGGIYFARSYDNGRSWSQPFPIAEGDCRDPQIAVTHTGQVHIIWREGGNKGAWSHRWSVDSGQNWAPAMRVRGFDNLQGRPALVSDLAGNMYLLGIAPDEIGEPLLRFMTWDIGSHQWGMMDAYLVGQGITGSAGVEAVLSAQRGQLDVVLRGTIPDGEDRKQTALFYTRRSVATAEQLPAPPARPAPTETAAPQTTASPTPRPTATVNPAPPPSMQSVGLGPLSLPLVGIGGILVAVVLIGGVLLLRLLWGQGGRYYKRRN